MNFWDTVAALVISALLVKLIWQALFNDEGSAPGYDSYW